MTSCITPLGNVIGKHVVTVEGVNTEDLTPVQAALHEHNGTQCGFCTPGFVVSLTGHALSENENNVETAVSSIAGNICRCTGYKSIERAVDDIVEDLNNKPKAASLDWLIQKNYLPDYFKSIPERLEKIDIIETTSGDKIIGGGTDLYVQKPDEISDIKADFYLNKENYKHIKEENDSIIVGASVTASEIMHSEIFQKYFPEITTWFKLISSEQIRNMGTVAGNFVNASPIGDLSIFFLALNAQLRLRNRNKSEREIALKNFFKAYKTLDLKDGEFISELSFKKPAGNFRFNFEKVSKRTYLDIASVNSAAYFVKENNLIKEVHISAGGLAPIPKYFEKTAEFLKGKILSEKVLNDAVEILLSEVSPISDIRGSKEYKSLLLKQLFFLHFKN